MFRRLDSVSGPEMETSSLCWAYQSRIHLKTETEFSLRNVVCKIKERTIDNVDNCDFHVNLLLQLLTNFQNYYQYIKKLNSVA
jgi:hypothetical protein